MTKFMDDHPGGDEVILSSTGACKISSFLDWELISGNCS